MNTRPKVLDCSATSRRAPSPRRNASAIERTIAHLRRTGRLTDGDDAALAVVRTTAAALDRASGSYDVAVVARVHLSAVAALLAGHQAPPDDELDRFLASLRAPEVGNPSQS